jgi:hypothetical protein
VSKCSLELNPPEKLVGPSGNPHIDEMNLLAVASVHGRPQGEILQAIHNWVIPFGLSIPNWWYYTFSNLLTHDLVQLELIVKPFLISLTVNTGMARGRLPNTDTPIW